MILGGAGGIGLELGRYLARTVQARLVLLGRSEKLSVEQREKIARIESHGGKVLYLQADATDWESMRAAVARAKERFGSIHGVIHSAIVLKDRALKNMDEQTFRAALAPKVRGSVILNKVLQNEPLDFMLFFSSAQSFLSNAGQSNYAAACTFKDAYALYLDQIRPYPVKVINWGYWGSVGIVADEDYTRRLAAQGIASIEPEEGMEAIQRVLGQGTSGQRRLSQVIAIKAQNTLLEAMGADLHQRIEPYPESIPSLVEALSHKVLSSDAAHFPCHRGSSLLLDEEGENNHHPHPTSPFKGEEWREDFHTRRGIPEVLPPQHGTQLQEDAQPHDAQLPDDTRPAGKQNEVSRLQRACNELERYGRLLLLDAFQRMGVFRGSGERYRKDQLKDRLKIAPGYSRLYEALMDILIKAGFVQLRGEEIVTTREVENKDQGGGLTGQEGCKDLGERRHLLAQDFPEIAGHLELLWACVSEYPEILTGRKDHMQVMFPNGSMELVENIYRGNTIADSANNLMADLIRLYLEHRIGQDAQVGQDAQAQAQTQAQDAAPDQTQAKAQARIQLIELGAGVGGTSTFILEAISQYRENVSYLYTDISAGFVQYGKSMYGDDYPFVEFKVLDIEKDPQEQGFEPGSADIVLASNVVHATRRMHHTIGQIKKLLKTNGLLILNEVTRVQDFATLTFGLTSGWWLFEDEENRLKGSPLLDAAGWKQVLAANGIGRTRIFTIPPQEAGKRSEQCGEEKSEQYTIEGGFEQSVIVGESDGLALVAALSPEVSETHEDKTLFPEGSPQEPALAETGIPDIPRFPCPGDSLALDEEDENSHHPHPASPLKGEDRSEGTSILPRPSGERAGREPLWQVRGPVVRSDKLATSPLRGKENSGSMQQAAGMQNLQDFQEMTREYVKEVLCRVLKIQKGEINNRASFEKYGVDSLVVMEINKELEKDFGKLPATLLFEHMSVEALAAYFITHHRPTLESMLAEKMK
ncbi:MAG: SDR family NAD(P)-dependent oxidoreductase, partial [bacterium]